MARSYGDVDFDSREAVEERLSCVRAFLQRHGFESENSLRDTSDVHSSIRVEALYPLDVAEEVGNEVMVNFLKMCGAKKRARNTSSGLFRSFLSLRSVASTQSRKTEERKNSSSATPVRSCLAKKNKKDDVPVMEIFTEWI